MIEHESDKERPVCFLRMEDVWRVVMTAECPVCHPELYVEWVRLAGEFLDLEYEDEWGCRSAADMRALLSDLENKEALHPGAWKHEILSLRACIARRAGGE